MLIEVKAIAKGRVQGVGFRASAQGIATRLALTGHAKNLPDGTVEIVVQGDKEAVGQFFQQLQGRFSNASIESVHSGSSTGDFSDFSIH